MVRVYDLSQIVIELHFSQTSAFIKIYTNDTQVNWMIPNLMLYLSMTLHKVVINIVANVVFLCWHSVFSINTACSLFLHLQITLTLKLKYINNVPYWYMQISSLKVNMLHLLPLDITL